MAANQQVARHAWRVFVHLTRTQLYDHMDALHRMAMGYWRSYDGNKDCHDVGPFELNEVDWYRRNKNWGPWLKRSNIWATQALTKLNRLVGELGKQCALGFLLFRDEKENPMDETLYLALEETKELLGCFIHGWQVTVCNMTLKDWCSFGSNVMFELGWEEWYRALASSEQAILRHHAVNEFAPL